MINKEFIERKIALIQEELAHLEKYAGFSVEEIIENFERQTVVERILERVISRALDINQHIASELGKTGDSSPMKYRDTFFALAEIGVFSQSFAEEISKSIGTRNILVHEYDKVDKTEIYLSIKDCLAQYVQYCSFVLEFLARK